MTTTTFQSTPTISDAFRQLMSALIAKLPAPAKASPRDSVADEANRVREMAYDYLATDPGFADDLFAAADRHELAAGAKTTVQ